MAMKMAAASEVTLLLLCCVAVSTAADRDKCDAYARTGQNFTVPLKNHVLAKTEKLKWYKESSLIVDRRPEKDVTQYKFFKGSQDDVYPNGSLNLMKMTKTDAGKYIPVVYTVNGVVVPTLSVHVCVIDHVPAPQVLAECQSVASTFTCNVTKMADIKFEWFQNDQALKNQKSQTLKLNTKKLAKDSFRCKVSNQVSSLTSDAVPDPCYKPTFVFPQKVMGYSIWIFVGGGGGIVLVLIVVVIVCCVLAKRKKRLQIKDEEELRLRWANPEQQQQQQQRHFHHRSHPPNHHQHHNHHHHHQQQQQQQQQQQPAGHTGPRQHRSKQPLNHQHPRGQDSGQPQPSPRRPAHAPTPAVKGDDEKPPPLPQPRKKAPRPQRV